MNWFTQQWHGGDISEERAAQVVADYLRHVEEIAPKLPEDLRRLAQELSVHDGLFRSLTVDAPARVISWTARCGDLQQGYRDIEVTYNEAELEAGTFDALVAVVKNPETEILYPEIDLVGDGRYAHRMLLWPYAEIAVEFGAITVDVREMPDRQLGPGEPMVRVTG